MRDRIAAREAEYERLDAAQLVKHAFGLRTEAQKRKKAATLLYLYAEPKTWPDGRSVQPAAIAAHAREAQTFASEVADAEVAFSISTYSALLGALDASPLDDVRQHAANIRSRFLLA
jgi:hypothetical protein